MLHVCAANQCRSVLAEWLLRAQFARRGVGDGDNGVVIAGAGLRALGGAPPWPAATDWLSAHGLLPPGGRSQLSRRLTPELVLAADLVLVATRALRDEVITAVPAAMRRVFAWRELAWLLDGLGPDELRGDDVPARVRELPELAARRRGLIAAPAGDVWDVLDPVARAVPLEVAAEQISAALAAVVDVVAPHG